MGNVSFPGQYSILILDDEPCIAEVLKRFFQESLSCQTFSTNNGDAAVELLKTGTFDLLSTDVRHPGLNGLELTRHVSQSFGTNIVILTGYKETTPEAAEAAGAAALFYKPVRLETFLQVVKRILGSPATTHTDGAGRAEGAVLLVDEVLLIF